MIAKTVLAVLLMVQAVAFGGAKVLRVGSMRQRAAHVGMSVDEYSRIGVLEIFAAVGLAIGAVVPVIGVLAACGLLVLLGGALVTHLRVGDRLPDLVPAMTVAALATAYIVVSVITS